MAASGTELAILPVGATEQHGSYLPLATDSLEAEAVARGVAERLDAFLLPVLPFSNSEAHAGFRGSVSLSPSTLLTVVKELALDLIGQGFRYVVLLNMHGGNLVLGAAGGGVKTPPPPRPARGGGAAPRAAGGGVDNFRK
ncbi:MAG: creatininase family protein, partial [Spirochaetaceae bacterium]|nr:creatininase family protein [Spirochaetaceae bacterium]